MLYVGWHNICMINAKCELLNYKITHYNQVKDNINE